MSLPTPITTISMVTTLLISDNLLLGRRGTAAVPVVVGQCGVQAGMLPTALPMCLCDATSPGDAASSGVTTLAARQEMEGTGVLGEYLLALVPSTDHGAATRWGSQAA